MKLSSFQKRLLNKIEIFFDTNDEISVESPTGSGKTFIIFNLVNNLINKYPRRNFIFIFLAPSIGSLHKQAFKKFEQYLELENNSNLSIKFFKDDEKLLPNTIYFIGSSSISRYTNILLNNLTEKSWAQQLETIAISQEELVILIDEAHNELGKDSYSKVNKLIRWSQYVFDEYETHPIKILRFSATLKEKADIYVSNSEVKSEKLIKSYNVDKTFNSLNKALSETMVTYNLIKDNLYKMNEFMRPLVLIKLPYGLRYDDDLIRQITKKIISKGFSNSNIGIWFSEYKYNMDNEPITKNLIKENISPISFLFFKQALITGVDIPRASIILKLDKTGNETQEKQLLGRVMRNPLGQKVNKILNTVFIYRFFITK